MQQQTFPCLMLCRTSNDEFSGTYLNVEQIFYFNIEFIILILIIYHPKLSSISLKNACEIALSVTVRWSFRSLPNFSLKYLIAKKESPTSISFNVIYGNFPLADLSSIVNSFWYFKSATLSLF